MNLIKLFLIVILLAVTNFIYSQTSVAVIDLRSVGLEEQFSVLLTDALRSELFKYEKFEVMNRENMQEIMGEQVFQASGVCDDNACYVEMGNVLGVEKIVTGSIGKLGSTYSLTIKMIDIETSKNDDSITEREKCSEDDLFIMIENAVKRLAGLKEKKISTPAALTDIKEIPRSNYSDGFTAINDDIKEWEMIGLTRDEYIVYKKSGLDLDQYLENKLKKIDMVQWNEYQNEKKSATGNFIKSALFAGWGQYSASSYNKAKWHMGIEIIGGSITLFSLYRYFEADKNEWESEESYWTDFVITSTFILGAFNFYSSIDAYFTTNRYNENLQQKYKLSLSPTYNPKNNGVGIGFAVNF